MIGVHLRLKWRSRKQMRWSQMRDHQVPMIIISWNCQSLRQREDLKAPKLMKMRQKYFHELLFLTGTTDIYKNNYNINQNYITEINNKEKLQSRNS